MKRAVGFALSMTGAFLCVSCFQTDILSKDTDPSSNKESFATGSTGDCSSWSPSTMSATASELDGVDILVVVDNSGSMAEEQQILAGGLFTLINTLTKPLMSDSNGNDTVLENVRLAVVTSDLGLSYGENRDIDRNPPGVMSCQNMKGDDGAFHTPPSESVTVNIADRQIRCEAEGGQCPPEFSCVDGLCRAPGGVTTVSCPDITEAYASTEPVVFNPDLALQAACMAEQGTRGCGFEQQLEAAVVGLKRHLEFIVDTHMLAVLVVTDEEDCSIENPALFSTAEWMTPQLQNTACNAGGNEANLFSTDRYQEKFLAMKDNVRSAVVFGAIVGVPTAAESAQNEWPLCEGTGVDIADCLANNPAMTIHPQEFHDAVGNTYIHFAPACVRENPSEPMRRITEARPGRRFVSVAQDFQENSFVFSICNPDWSPAMYRIAKIIARQTSTACFPKKMDWVQSATQPASCENGNCGESTCDVTVRITRDIDGEEACPDRLYAGQDEAAKQAYLAKRVVEPIQSSNGQVTLKNIYCPIPKLPTPLDCKSAAAMERTTYAEHSGWYYCENETDTAEQALSDLENDVCTYNLRLSALGMEASHGNLVTVQCLEEGELSTDQCEAPDHAALGSACTQPGFAEDNIAHVESDGPAILSFQDGCDCMTYLRVHNFDTADVEYAHFCTRPCSVETQNCPGGFTCEPTMSPAFDLPEALSEAYCVPDCFTENMCFGYGERCAPTTDKGDVWTCQTEE